MRALLVIAGLGVLTSCVESFNLNSVDYDSLFNDANSKVWMVDEVIQDGENVAPTIDLHKDLMVFHRSSIVDIIPLADILKSTPKKGDYYLDSDKKTMTMEFQDESIWSFDLGYITEDSVLFVPKADSQLQFSLKIKPFPEL
ncbi:MAG: hypothetical protein ACPGVI_05425 [Crocinitomicaceae bacterium]